MRTPLKLGLVLVGIGLVVTLLGANVVWAAQATVLDAEFTKETAEDAGLAEEFRDGFVGEAASNLENASADGLLAPGDLDPEATAESAVTSEYVRGQVDANIDRLYAFLHGERENPGLRFDLRPVKQNLADEVGDAIDVEAADVVAETDAQVDEETTVEPGTVERMLESEAGYEAEREAFRADLRERVLRTAVDEAMGERSNDELLGLVIDDYDPDQYTDPEKEQLVRDREDEIRATLRSEIDGSEAFEKRVEAKRQALLEASRADIRQASADATGEYSENVTAAVAEIHLAVVDGLLGDQSYDEFTARVDSATGRLSAEAERRARAEIDGNVPDTLELSGEMGPEERQTLDTAARAVGWVTLAGYALPVLALLLAGLSYAVSRSPVATLSTIGSGLSVAGLVSIVGAVVLENRVAALLEAELAAGESGAFPAFALGVVDGVSSRLVAQSLALLAAGLVVLVFAFAVQEGHLDGYVPESWAAEGGAPDAADE